MKVNIKFIKDHPTGFKKGQEEQCDKRQAQLLESKGFVEILKDCDGCDDEKPCEDCEKKRKK